MNKHLSMARCRLTARITDPAPGVSDMQRRRYRRVRCIRFVRQCTHSWDLRPLCPEAEPPPTLLNSQVREARRLQPAPERVGIHRQIPVTQVDQPKEKGVHAVEADKYAARTKHPPCL